MERLTEKITSIDLKPKGYHLKNILECPEGINKLGKLEDIEEELGIDLITFFKVISQGYIFVREHNTEEKEIVAEDVRPNFLTHTFDFKEPRKEIGKGRPFSRISKTWTLTREELENEIVETRSTNVI